MSQRDDKTSPHKTIVIAIHGPYQPWINILDQGQLRTWMLQKSTIKIVNVFGRKISHKFLDIDRKLYFLRWSNNKLIAYFSLGIEALTKWALNLDRFKPGFSISVSNEPTETWKLEMPDSLLLQGIKNMAVFRESLNHDFNFLVTTITSSYLNLTLLEKFLEEVEPKNFLGGRIEKSGDMSYQQGSFRVYSRDVVENLVEHSNKYKHWKIEDIAMGTLAASLYSEFTEIPNKTLQSVTEVDKLTKEDLETTISYRCKSLENGIRNDVKVMLSLHERILFGR